MSEVRHKGVIHTKGGQLGGTVTWSYKMPRVTLPHEDPEEWAKLSSEVKTYSLKDLEKEKEQE